MKRGLTLLCALAAACGGSEEDKRLPAKRMPFPTGVAVQDHFLYVVASNFNLAFQGGAVLELDLDALVPATLPAEPADVAMGTPPRVLVDSFGGPLVLDSAGERLFTATRGSNRLWRVPLSNGQLACPEGGACAQKLPMPLVDPFALAVGNVALQDGTRREVVFVGQLRAPGATVDSEGGAPLAVVAVDDGAVLFTRDLGAEPLSGLAFAPQGERLFVTGRWRRSGTNNLLRVVDGAGVPKGAVRAVDLAPAIRGTETRGVALSSDGRTLYAVSQDVTFSVTTAHVLAELEILGPGETAPVRVRRTVALPEGPSEVHVIARPGAADLVAITCPDSHLLLLYDAGAGAIVAQLHMLRGTTGGAPFAMAHRVRGSAAELFVSLFLDDRVALIEIPLDVPQRARLAMWIGGPE